MTEYMTEQEQIELLKSWIKQYSLVIIAGVMIAIVTILSWRYWQQREDKIFSHASAIYDEMLTKRAQNDTNATLIQAKKLFSHYPKTVYGQIATLMLAREANNKKNYAYAETLLQKVIKKSSTASFRQIARLRLARIMIAEHKSDMAIQLLEKVDDKNFSGLINEVKGDAYFAMKNIKMARESYGLALSKLPNADEIRPLLRMKFDNLAT